MLLIQLPHQLDTLVSTSCVDYFCRSAEGCVYVCVATIAFIRRDNHIKVQAMLLRLKHLPQRFSHHAL